MKIDWTKPIEVNHNTTGVWGPARFLGIVKDDRGLTHIIAMPAPFSDSEVLARATVDGRANGFQFVRNKPEEMYINVYTKACGEKMTYGTLFPDLEAAKASATSVKTCIYKLVPVEE